MRRQNLQTMRHGGELEVQIASSKPLTQGAELPYPCSYPGTRLRDDVCGSRQAANTFTTTQVDTATAIPAYA